MLTVRHLDVFRGRTHVLRDVDLEVGRGEIVALIGANGAGKTTTLRTISGLLPARNGENLRELGEEARREMELILVDSMTEVVAHALLPAATATLAPGFVERPPVAVPPGS